MIPTFTAPYVFHEYPKALHHPLTGDMTIVGDAGEEEAVLVSWKAEDAPPKNKGGRPRKTP